MCSSDPVCDGAMAARRGGAVMVCGGVVVDLVLNPPTLPRPGHTVLSPSYALFPGGKGANQAVSAARSGAPTAFVGAVGNDDFASVGLAGLEQAGVDVSCVARLDGAATAVAAICVDAAGENQICVGNAANFSFRAEMAADLLAKQAGEVGDGARHRTVLVLQMEVSLEENWKLVESAKATAGATVCMLNVAPAAPVPLNVLRNLDYIIVNEHECVQVVAELDPAFVPPPAEAPELGCADKLATMLGHPIVVLTLGEKGAVAVPPFTGRVGVSALPLAPGEAVDTVGAGDAFIGAFAAVVAAQGDGTTEALTDAMKAGAVAGSLACTQPGAQSACPTLAEIKSRIGEVRVAIGPRTADVVRQVNA